MIYDAVEVAYTVILANFATDLAALVAAKGVSGITSTSAVVKRQDVVTAIEKGSAKPVIGVDVLTAATQAKSQGKRDTMSTVVADYYAEGTDPVALAKQAELAAEAVLLSIDRMWPTAEGGAGLKDGAVRIQMTKGYEEAREGVSGTVYWRRATVTFQLVDRDTIA